MASAAVSACRTAPVAFPASSRDASSIPAAPATRMQGFLGEYGPDSAIRIVLERDGQLILRRLQGLEVALRETRNDTFASADQPGLRYDFARDASGRAAQVAVGSATLSRRALGPESGTQLAVTPVRPMAELRAQALAATPPAEAGPFRASDLVELVRLDPTIKLEIRYATSNNLFGTPFYTQPRAFLQRPAAEALVRANAALRARGYGLLVHDGYRPWSVTKMFWEAAPLDKRIFVADPAQGSRHNRGAAVDLTLYDLATGAPVEMPSTYDETTDRAAADYPGGTSRQRWLRDLLRHAMEAERFTVNVNEWWHFDYADWRQYPIGNVAFEQLR